MKNLFEYLITAAFAVLLLIIGLRCYSDSLVHLLETSLAPIAGK